MKRPSFQFYPADWLRDTALRTCSTGARGLWIDMICYMHEGSPYGYLKVNNKVILPINLARMVGLTLDEVNGYLDELKDSGVYEIDNDGSIYSRRMIRDENLRKIRAEGGKLGGNPKLKGNNKVNQEVKQKSTPSSSSSSSSSINKIQAPDGVSLQVWNDFVEQRKKARAVISENVIKTIAKEAAKAGWSLEQALAECAARGWRGFKAEWVKDNKPAQKGDKMQEFWSDIDSFGSKPAVQIGVNK